MVSLTICMILLSACKKEEDKKEPTPPLSPKIVTDIDGNEYPYIHIGSTMWMAENLRVTKYNDGSPILHLTDAYDWETTDSGAYTWYDNDFDTYGNAYGALYNWKATASDYNGGKNICPEGWTVPEDADWQDLMLYVDTNAQDHYNNMAGKALKSCRQVHSPLGENCDVSAHPRWSSNSNHHGTDRYGFAALPGGTRFVSGNFLYVGHRAQWWSNTVNQNNSVQAWTRSISFDLSALQRSSESKIRGFSVRCVKK